MLTNRFKMYMDLHLWCFLNIITLSATVGLPAGHCNSGEDLLQKCPMKLPELNSPEISTREELDKICVQLQQGIKCIDDYINVCMGKSEQVIFRHIYAGTTEVVKELCTRGSYQDDYLKHADCVRTISSEYETCETNYEKALTTINRHQQGDQTDYTSLEDRIRTVCCSFQEYLTCSEESVQRSCGDEAALFTSAFLKRTSSNIIKNYCFEYNRKECGLTDKSSHISLSDSVLLLVSVASLINIAFYASGNLVPTSPSAVFGGGSEAAIDHFNCTAAITYDGTGATAFGQQMPAFKFWSAGNVDIEGGFGSTDLAINRRRQSSETHRAVVSAPCPHSVTRKLRHSAAVTKRPDGFGFLPRTN